MMKMETRSGIAGKVVIVTGASSGIGEAAAREFARAGARTVLAARRAGRLDRLAGEIQEAGGVALPVPTDLTDPKQIAHLVKKTLETFQRIDIVTNIAGWGHYDWFEELTTEALRNPYEVNIIGMAELIRQVIPTMKTQRSGIIINMSSYASKVAVPPLTVYASTKYAVDGLTDGLRRELHPWGIDVIRVHPSAVTGTEFKEKAIKDGGVTYSTLPLGRVSREHVAREIVRLAERPQRSLFIGRLYDVAVLLNAFLPGFVDWNTSRWVKSKRRKELQGRRGSIPLGQAGVSVALLSLGILLARMMLKKSV